MTDVHHRSTDATWEGGDLDDLSAAIMLTRSDGYGFEPELDEPARPYLQVDGDGDCTIEGLESLGAWLIAQAATLREAIEAEGVLPAQRGPIDGNERTTRLRYVFEEGVAQGRRLAAEEAVTIPTQRGPSNVRAFVKA